MGEISHRRGQKYMTVVVDHESGRVVWMADKHGKGVLNAFFDALGPDHAERLTRISGDGALWIVETLTAHAPHAVRVMDPFRVVARATEALDTERRAAWNRARHEAGNKERARALKHSRFALWKNQDDLTDRQAAKLAWIAVTDSRLHRAWRLKEAALRAVFALAGTRPTAAALDCWTGWARRCRIDTFVDRQRRIRRHHDAIRAALTTGMSNGLVESTNTKTRLIIRPASTAPTRSPPSSCSPSPETGPPSPDANPRQSDPHIRQESLKNSAKPIKHQATAPTRISPGPPPSAPDDYNRHPTAHTPANQPEHTRITAPAQALHQ
ncbi:ISL3 family transposase [Streptomyces vinaceus]